MGPNRPPSFDKLESQVRMTTSTRHQDELNLMGRLLNTHFDGFMIQSPPLLLVIIMRSNMLGY